MSSWVTKFAVRSSSVWLTSTLGKSLPASDSDRVCPRRVSVQQVEYRAISERIAYENPRVVSFSQYLLRDSDPSAPGEYGGFESGLRFADGKPKPSLPAFRLPLAVRRIGSKAWGRRIPA